MATVDAPLAGGATLLERPRGSYVLKGSADWKSAEPDRITLTNVIPDDGKVVSVDHGCGAHSDGDITADNGVAVLPAVDELGYDMLHTGATVPDSVLEKLDHELA